MPAGALRQYADALEAQAPPGRILAHLMPQEMQQLELLTGSQQFQGQTGIRKFANGGKVAWHLADNGSPEAMSFGDQTYSVKDRDQLMKAYLALIKHNKTGEMNDPDAQEVLYDHLGMSPDQAQAYAEGGRVGFAAGGTTKAEIDAYIQKYLTDRNQFLSQYQGGIDGYPINPEALWITTPTFQGYEKGMIDLYNKVNDPNLIASELAIQQPRITNEPLYANSATNIVNALKARQTALASPTSGGTTGGTTPATNDATIIQSPDPENGNFMTRWSDGSWAGSDGVRRNADGSAYTGAAPAPSNPAPSNPAPSNPAPSNPAPTFQNNGVASLGAPGNVQGASQWSPGAVTPMHIPNANMSSQVPARVEAYKPNTPYTFQFASGGLVQASQALRQAGRGGDTDLAYITPDQARMLGMRTGHGHVNPATGLPEYGLFSFLGKLLKVVVPVALAVFAPGIGAAVAPGLMASVGTTAFTMGLTAIGTTAFNKVTGSSWGDALKAGAFAGLGAGLGEITGGTDALRGTLGATSAAGAAGTQAAVQGAAQTAGQTAANAAAAGAQNSIGQGLETVVSTAPKAASGLAAAAGAATVGGAAAAGSNLANASKVEKPTNQGQGDTPEDGYGTPEQSAAQPASPAGGLSQTSYVPTNADLMSAGVQPIGDQAPKSFLSKAMDFATKPLAFNDAGKGLLPSMGRALTTPLGMAGAYLLLSGGKKGNAEDYKAALAQKAAEDSKMNQDFINSINNAPQLRKLRPTVVGPSYGLGPMSSFWDYSNPDQPFKVATGGRISPLRAAAQRSRGRAFSGHAQGPGGGQDDLIDARLSNGEFVFDATTVSDIGDGSNEVGAHKLEQLRQAVRKVKGRNHQGPIPQRTPPLMELMHGYR